MSDRSAAQLLALLQEERVAIRTAAFDALENLTTKKEDMFATFLQDRPPHAEMEKIRVKMAENQILLAAAIAGVKAARDRIDALHRVRQELSVYDRSGQLAKVTAPRPGLEKKA